MAALKPVGSNYVLATSTVSAATTFIAQQSDSIRIVAETAGVHIAFGANPTATANDFYVATTDTSVISLGPVASQRVVGFTKGATTTLDFPEGTGCPFAVGDAVTLTTNGAAAFDFEHKTVLTVDQTSGVGGYFNTRITVDYDSSGVSGTFGPTWATLRKSIQVAAMTDTGTGKAFIQQVQVS